MERAERRASRQAGRRGVILGVAAAVAAAAALIAPALASAHLERPSYWPDPGPDTSVDPPAGGEPPKVRSLRSAVRGEGPGEVRVVCKGAGGRRSLLALNRSVRKARQGGFRIRPSEPKRGLGKRKARLVKNRNRRLAARCEYQSVQKAVNDSGNNDRVVVMPGRYIEAHSRRQPTNDPRCADLSQLDTAGREAPSFEYQSTCPNDQNLVYVQGREIAGDPPSPPLENRQGIPDEGPCLRCNLQIEGSGVKPTDVVLDAAKRGEGKIAVAKPGEPVKDVVLRADRADGFVVRNLTAKGAAEHGIYVEETDGYRIARSKMFWNHEYGNLSFASDHGVYSRCDAFGSGDASLYPGGTPETGEQVDKSFYPDGPRVNTVIRRCDMRGSALGYSGSMGNAVRITQSDIYGNGVGIASDTISAQGHPGFPSDSLQIDHNLIYANNLNLYDHPEIVEPTVGVPVGTGVLLAGVNNARVHDNHFFDNWRRGTMLLAIPDAVVTPEGRVNDGASCESPVASTSCNTRFFDNHMGVAPEDFRFPKALTRGLGGPPIHGEAGSALPNGVDFWWDEFTGNTANCWFGNTGPDGTRGSLRTDPPLGPTAGASLPAFLPEDCGSSLGVGNAAKTAVLLDCSTWSGGQTSDDFLACDWFETPPRPGTAAARAAEREHARAVRRFEDSDAAERLRERLDELSSGAERAE